MNMSLFGKIFTRMMAVLFASLSLMCGIAFARFYVVPPDPVVKMDPKVDGRVNILCLATDASGMLTDTIMIASLDSRRSVVNLLSIPRDTRVHMGPKYGYQRINAAYSVGDPDTRHENTIKYVKEVTGGVLPINYYVLIKPAGFRNIIDALGGVWFDVPQRMHYEDPAQNLYINLYPGEQLLDGDKAEQFTRFRTYPEGDLARIAAQQNFVKALFEQKLKPEYILKSPEIYSKLEKAFDTDIRISDFPVFKDYMGKLNKESMVTFELPGAPQWINGASYFMYDLNAAKELIEMEFLGKKPDDIEFSGE